MGRSAFRGGFWLVAILSLFASISASAQNVDLAAAEAQFVKSCGTCHTLDEAAPARQGPVLMHVLGATAGTNPNFSKYSDALKKAGADGLVWTEDKLDAWLTNPAKLVPGVNMPYRQRDPEKRKLVIAFLKSRSAQ